MVLRRKGGVFPFDFAQVQNETSKVLYLCPKPCIVRPKAFAAVVALGEVGDEGAGFVVDLGGVAED